MIATMTTTQKLNDIVAQLYGLRRNSTMCSKIQNISEADLQDILETPSKNKWLIMWKHNTNCGFLMAELTSKWIHYYENGFKFDREIINDVVPQVHIGTLNNSWNFALQNHWTQNITENDISDFIKLLEANQNITQKDEIKQLLAEFRKVQDKNILVDIFSILWNSASVGSFYFALKALLM